MDIVGKNKCGITWFSGFLSASSTQICEDMNKTEANVMKE